MTFPGRSSNSFRSGNPTLNSKSFDVNETITGKKMTIDGTVNRSIIALTILSISAYYSYTLELIPLMMIGFIAGFILAIITMIKKTLSPVTVPLYCVAQGCALGGISFLFNQMYDGIVIQAISLTLAIFLSLLFAYKSKMIKVTENFKLGMTAATGGIFLIYILSFFMRMFGLSGLPILDINNGSIVSIGFSLFVVFIASLTLVMDFDFIEQAAENGAPKYMEWYGAFGLIVSLVWLYMEILRLLAKLRSR